MSPKAMSPKKSFAKAKTMPDESCPIALFRIIRLIIQTSKTSVSSDTPLYSIVNSIAPLIVLINDLNLYHLRSDGKGHNSKLIHSLATQKI